MCLTAIAAPRVVCTVVWGVFQDSPLSTPPLTPAPTGTDIVNAATAELLEFREGRAAAAGTAQQEESKWGHRGGRGREREKEGGGGREGSSCGNRGPSHQDLEWSYVGESWNYVIFIRCWIGCWPIKMTYFRIVLRMTILNLSAAAPMVLPSFFNLPVVILCCIISERNPIP